MTELNPSEEKGRVVDSPEWTLGHKPSLSKTKLIKEIKTNLSSPNRNGVEKKTKKIGSVQRETGQHPTVLQETKPIIGNRNQHLVTYLFVLL